MKSLSARLLVLTAFFVMVCEVLVFVPSVARFRLAWFENHIAAGHLAALALAASPGGHVDQDLANALLADVGAHEVVLRRPGGMVLMLDKPPPPQPSRTIDIRRGTVYGMIRWSLWTLIADEDQVLRVIGAAPNDPAQTVELLLDLRPLKAAMWDFGARILELSIVISLVTAALVYLSLQWLLVRPMRRITASMTLFREDPEDASRHIQAGRRHDEIGDAERELAELERV